MTTVASAASEVADEVGLRWLTADDWQELRRMRLAALKDSPRSFLSRYEDEVCFGEDRWRAELRRGNWILACMAGEPVGMIGVTTHSEIPRQDRYVEYLWIDPFSRGTGTASAFVRKVIDELADARVGSIWLWIMDGNDAAWNFYKKLGFVVDVGPIGLERYPDRWETRMTLSLSCPLPASPAGS